MAIPTKTVRGLSAILVAARTICKLNARFRAVYLLVFSGPELALLDALTAACQAFADAAPFGG